MVDMSEIYKNKKKALVPGSGDLATGVGIALYRAGFQVIMTDIAVPLTVRREVAMSRAVYEGRAKVEGIEGILVRNYQEALAVLEENKIAVIVDPKAEIRKEFHPDLLVDAILAKKNMGTRRTDAPYVIGLGPGFTAGKDVHAVIETMRGETLADIIYDGQADSEYRRSWICGRLCAGAPDPCVWQWPNGAKGTDRRYCKEGTASCRNRRKTCIFPAGRCDPRHAAGRCAGEKRSEDRRCRSKKRQEIVLPDFG